MSYPRVQEKNVLITGCSTGIGAAAARHLRDRGWRVLPTARKEADLAALRNQGFVPLHLDLADEASVRRVIEAALARFGGRIGGLVNNAGFGQPGAVEDISRTAMRYQFEVNVFGMQDLTNGFIPFMRKQGWGRIVNISSIVGILSLPFMGVYSSSKFAMEAISDALRVELKDAGIAVSLVEPGPIESAFRKNSALRAREALSDSRSPYGAMYEKELKRRDETQREMAVFTRPAEAVAPRIVHALESTRPRRRYPVTTPSHVGMILRRIAPDSFIDRMMWSRWKRKTAS